MLRTVGALNPEASKEQNNANVKSFKETLPDIKPNIQLLLSLQFFALCPNGKRIPVEKLCEEFARDPADLAYRTMEDRLVLVLQAVFPAEDVFNGSLSYLIERVSEHIYWQQAFYLSTGESSGMGGTWLPFNGILLQNDTRREYLQFSPYYERRERRPNEKTLKGAGWFSKEVFGAPQDRSFFRFSSEMTVEQRKKFSLEDIFGNLYLPEGNYLYYRSPYDRFGTLSYALASHAIGGNLFARGQGGSHLRLGYSPYGIPDAIKDSVEAHMNKPSPLQSCFVEMASTYPITKPNGINAYIDKEKGVYYMNAFRAEGIFPPGLAFVQVPMKSLGYSMPVKSYWDALAYGIHQIWNEYHLGKLSLEDVKTIFANPRGQIEAYLKKERNRTVMPNEPNFSFNLSRESYAFRPKILNYYGGKKTRRQIRIKTRGGNRKRRNPSGGATRKR